MPGRRVARYRRLLGSALALAIVTVLAGLPIAGAQSNDGDRRQQLNDEIKEMSAQEAQALEQLREVQAKKKTVDAKVAELDAQVVAAEAKLAALAAEASQLAAELQTLEAQLVDARVQLGAAAAALYRSARTGALYGAILTGTPDDLLRTDQYLDLVSEKRDRFAQRVATLRKAVDDQKAAAEANAAQAQSEHDRVAELRAEVEPARVEAAQQQADEQRILDSVRADKAQHEAELQELQAASDAIAALLRSQGTGSGQAGACGARPVPGAITSSFGYRYHPIYNEYRLHAGVDMAAGSGTPIRSCRAGTVVQASAGWNGGFGNMVLIDHGGGMATLYAHMSSISAQSGQQVAAGDVIGNVGSTGSSTGPHLHFEVRLNGNPVDPAGYL